MNISIIGATGFLGTHLVGRLLREPQFNLSVLTRQGIDSETAKLDGHSAKLIKGDIEDFGSLVELFDSTDVIIYLAYPHRWSLSRHLAAIKNVIEAATRCNVPHIIHCSTAAVVGDVKNLVITEDTVCKPRSEYEKIKFAIEDEFRMGCAKDINLSILRPTAIIGHGGENLQKLIGQLQNDKLYINYLRSVVFGRRSLNLVCVENVVEAILFLMQLSSSHESGIYLISDDEAIQNNYQDVERMLMSALDIPYYKWRKVYLPPLWLSILLRLFNKNGADPYRKFIGSKLEALGYKKVTNIHTGITGIVQ